MKSGEWTLRSRRVVTPSGTIAADVVIRHETIAVILDYDGPESEGVILDVGDLFVLPGLVTLYREGPGRATPSRYESVTRDAAAGGVTTLVGLPPDDDPESSSPSAFLNRMAAAEGKIRVDCGLVLALGRGHGDLVESWLESGVVAVEAVLDERGSGSGSKSRLPVVSTEADLRAAMPILARFGRPLIVHPQGLGSSTASSTESGGFRATLSDHEFDTLRLLIGLCRESRCSVHLIQPSATEALPMIAEARAEGLPMTVETGMQSLRLSDDEIAEGSSTFGLSVSRQGPDGRNRLWEGLRGGLIDVVGLAPHQAKAPPVSRSPGPDPPADLGSSPLRLALPSLWNEASRQGFTFNDLARWMASNTARALGLSRRKGSIVAGLDADFVIFDPVANRNRGPQVSMDRPRSASRPFESRITGKVEATILRGILIYQGGQFFQASKGSVVLRFEETMPTRQTVP